MSSDKPDINKPYFNGLLNLFNAVEFTSPLHAEVLNSLATHHSTSSLSFRFIAEDKRGRADPRYYEQVIFEDKLIPTRYHWHDTFNALMWMLFPNSKSALNKLHIEDIEQYGVHPRSRRRNRITLFDECGGVIVYQDDAMREALEQHQWCQAFWDKRKEWGQSVRYFIFGHALYEMLLQPHIGLTGKFLAIKVCSAFWQKTATEQYQYLDEQLVKLIVQDNIFAGDARLHPLPVLGIPGWFEANEVQDFYLNTEYFRPRKTLK